MDYFVPMSELNARTNSDFEQFARGQWTEITRVMALVDDGSEERLEDEPRVALSRTSPVFPIFAVSEDLIYIRELSEGVVVEQWSDGRVRGFDHNGAEVLNLRQPLSPPELN